MSTDDQTEESGPSIVEAELDRQARDARVAYRTFLGVGVIVAVIALFYVPTGEDAGQVMLVLAAVLGLWCGVFLWRHRSSHPTTFDAHRDALDEIQYLPHASVWPFWIGLATFFITNGLVLGTWFLVPGGVLLVAGMVGFIRQSRARS